MAKIHTHYDNLKVSRDAPAAVIKAAYRILSQQYHPDRSSLPEAGRIMTIINASYAVLTDPAKRAAHDAWVTTQEQAGMDPPAQGQPQPPRNSKPQAERTTPTASAPERYMFWPLIGELLRAVPIVCWVLIAVVAGVSMLTAGKRSAPSGSWETPSQYAADAEPAPPAAPAYQRSANAPNGWPWPTEADYVGAYPMQRTDGHSTVTVDNARNTHDVYVKLVATDERTGEAARHVFLPARQSFTLRDITPGTYELRYMNLDSGAAYKAKPFQLTEEPTMDGINYSTVEMTLYTVQNGNMRMQTIAQDQF